MSINIDAALDKYEEATSLSHLEVLASLVDAHLGEGVALVITRRLVGDKMWDAQKRTGRETALNFLFNLIG